MTARAILPACLSHARDHFAYTEGKSMPASVRLTVRIPAAGPYEVEGFAPHTPGVRVGLASGPSPPPAGGPGGARPRDPRPAASHHHGLGGTHAGHVSGGASRGCPGVADAGREREALAGDVRSGLYEAAGPWLTPPLPLPGWSYSARRPWHLRATGVADAPLAAWNAQADDAGFCNSLHSSEGTKTRGALYGFFCYVLSESYESPTCQ